MKKHLFVFVTFTVCISFFALDVTASEFERQAELDSLYSLALDYSSHGRFDDSNTVINGIMSEFNLSKNGKIMMYDLLAHNAWVSGNYPLYFQYLSKCLKRKELKKRKMERALSLLPLETLERPEEDVHVRYSLDSLYYEGKFKGCNMRLPAMIGGKEEMMLLDNGCGFSLASESFAAEHGIRPTGVTGNAVGVVEKVSMWMGVADSLSVASLTFKNILFAVVLDEYLQNPVTEIDAALGANIFRLVGDMDFDNVSREIVFPFEQHPCESNISVDGSSRHFADVVVGEDTLKFQLDLGASLTDFSSNYFSNYKDRIVEECTADSERVGGIGGFTDSLQVYRMENVEIKACGGCYSMRKATISTTKSPNEKDEYGLLGLDFLLNFKRARLNLKTMYHLWVE